MPKFTVLSRFRDRRKVSHLEPGAYVDPPGPFETNDEAEAQRLIKAGCLAPYVAPKDQPKDPPKGGAKDGAPAGGEPPKGK